MPQPMEEGAHECMNPACHCTVEPGKEYCSEYCEAEAHTGKSGQSCECDHTMCREART